MTRDEADIVTQCEGDALLLGCFGHLAGNNLLEICVGSCNHHVIDTLPRLQAEMLTQHQFMCTPVLITQGEDRPCWKQDCGLVFILPLQIESVQTLFIQAWCTFQLQFYGDGRIDKTELSACLQLGALMACSHELHRCGVFTRIGLISV